MDTDTHDMKKLVPTPPSCIRSIHREMREQIYDSLQISSEYEIDNYFNAKDGINWYLPQLPSFIDALRATFLTFSSQRLTNFSPSSCASTLRNTTQSTDQDRSRQHGTRIWSFAFIISFFRDVNETVQLAYSKTPQHRHHYSSSVTQPVGLASAVILHWRWLLKPAPSDLGA